jgi:predicted lipoprotein with Yx(FWY)xxD motif
MKRTVFILVAIAALAAAGAAFASSRATAARAATVQLRHTSLGKILVDRQGFTLYMFTADRLKHDQCANVSGCMSVWPALRSKGNLVAGAGVKRSLLRTITLAGGSKQVTYAGHPLYTYVGDSGPGQTSYVGARQFGGAWYALNAGGKAVK